MVKRIESGCKLTLADELHLSLVLGPGNGDSPKPEDMLHLERGTIVTVAGDHPENAFEIGFRVNKKPGTFYAPRSHFAGCA
ncbi:MAG: hypothetical protein NTZ87_01950 [Candidatus Nomurabacteria bacterium]|nr:hypothetical protein [Candidatus Nomurabacteria bacterium]